MNKYLWAGVFVIPLIIVAVFVVFPFEKKEASVPVATPAEETAVTSNSSDIAGQQISQIAITVGSDEYLLSSDGAHNVKLDDGGSIDFFGETDGEGASRCWLSYCQLPEKGEKTLNGITWTYLGSHTYCDLGFCSEPVEVYRLVTGGERYFIIFRNLKGQEETILKTAVLRYVGLP